MSRRWRVERDARGIPLCWGETLDDLAYAQGRSAAIDRAWQIEVERRRSEATSAALLGPSDWDDFAERADLAGIARAAVAGLDDETLAWVDAYVSGVNDGLDEGSARAPEFAATGTQAERWERWSPAGVFLVQHVLMGNFGHLLWRRYVRAQLGEDALDLLSHEGVPLGGSNAWALTGSRTATGAPMIAADPHRVLEAPGIYQQVRLTTPDIDVSGLAFAGVPGVPHFGHAGSVAWAVTHAMADYQQIAPDADPVVPHPISPAGVDGDIGLATMRRLLLARTVDDVDTALDGWVEPVNAVVIAGADGRVRERVAGRLVTLESSHSPGGMQIQVGKPSSHSPGGMQIQVGTVAAPAARRDLADGLVVVHANDRRASVAALGEEFAAPHRAHRITALLGEREDWDVAGLAAIQTDTRLGSWPTFQTLLGGVAATGPAEELRRRLLAWDGHMDAGRHDAALFAAWRTELVLAVAAHPRLAPIHEPAGLAALFAPWVDPVSRVGAGIERIVHVGRDWGLPLDELAVQALVRVAQAPADDRTWGERHVAPFVRAEHTGTPPSGPLGGDGDCVLATAAAPGLSDLCWRGPAARLVWSLDGPSSWVVPLGADGPADSPHAHDQHDTWRAGDLHTLTDEETT